MRGVRISGLTVEGVCNDSCPALCGASPFVRPTRHERCLRAACALHGEHRKPGGQSTAPPSRICFKPRRSTIIFLDGGSRNLLLRQALTSRLLMLPKSKLDRIRPEIEAPLANGPTRKFIEKRCNTIHGSYSNRTKKNGIKMPETRNLWRIRYLCWFRASIVGFGLRGRSCTGFLCLTSGAPLRKAMERTTA